MKTKPQYSKQIPHFFNFLGLILCFLLVSAFKFNYYSNSNTATKVKIFDELSPNLDTLYRVFITDLAGNKLSSKEAIIPESILVNVLSDNDQIEVLELTVSYFQENKLQKTLRTASNRIDIDKQFGSNKNGKIDIEILKIRKNGKKQDLSKTPLEVSLTVSTANAKLENVPIFLQVLDAVIYKDITQEIFLHLPNNYSNEFLTYKTDNGKVEKLSETGHLKILAGKTGKLNLEVFYKDNSIHTQSFRVLPVPPPTVFVADASGRKLNTNRPIPQKELENMKIRVTPDQIFRTLLPTEANYALTSVEITQFRGGRSISNFRMEEKNAEGDILIDTSKIDFARGDGFNIKVRGVNRIKTNGETEAAPILRPNIQFQSGS